MPKRPEQQSPTALRPNQQTCRRCGAVDCFNFHVPDEVWKAVAGPEWTNEVFDSVLCLACFDDLAFERGVNYAHVITHVVFAGRQVCIGFTIFDEDARDLEEFAE
jgi:hypothetical protein